MSRLKIFLLITGLIVLFDCHKKSPTKPPLANNIHPQVDIPCPSLANSPWPMFHHDPQSTGRSQYIGPRKGKIKWTFKPEGCIHESIAIGQDSTIYFVSLYEQRDGRQKSSLYAVKPDGTLKWRYLFDISSMDAKPLITADGIIYLYVPEHIPAVYAILPDGHLSHKIIPGLERFDHITIGLDGNFYFTASDGYLYAMTGEGVILWKITIENGFVSKLPVFSPDGNTIYVFQHQEPYYVSALCAIDISGELKWRFSFNDTLCSSEAVPVIDNEGNIYLGVGCSGGNNRFYSISPRGEVNWNYHVNYTHDEEAVIDPDGNICFQSNDNKLVSLDYSGNLRWQKELSDRMASLLCDGEGVVYAFQPNVTAYTADGEELWQIPLDGQIGRITSSAIGYDGILYVGTYSSDSKLYAIE